jgi:hypothetical protein
MLELKRGIFLIPPKIILMKIAAVARRRAMAAKKMDVKGWRFIFTDTIKFITS